MEPYTGIAVFELSHWDAQTGKKTTYFREDFYIVYANSEEEAKKRVEAMAQTRCLPGRRSRHQTWP